MQRSPGKVAPALQPTLLMESPVETREVPKVADSYLLRGILSLAMGALFVTPLGRALSTMLALFSFYAFFDGVVAIGTAVRSRAPWQLGVLGAVGVVLGALSWFNPVSSAMAFYGWVAVWALCKGLLEVLLALRVHGEGEEWVVLDGMVSLITGSLLLVLPQAGFLRLGWLIGVYALVLGVLQLGIVVRLRHIHLPRVTA